MSDDQPSIRHRIDQICDRFEQALKAGQMPNIDDYVEGFPASDCERLRSELLGLQEDYWQSPSGFEATVDSSAERAGTKTEVKTGDGKRADDDKTTPESDVTIDSGFSSSNSHAIVGEKLKYFGNYEILSEIARGGMGVVYRARQTTLGRIVALKMILSGQLAGEHEIARFRSEAEAAANLDHPGIVPIYEVGQHDDHHYFSMGLVDGPSLSQVIRDGPMEPKSAAACLSKIADAVGYANDHGVIHRDLKPGNILLDSAGDPHVTDFGLAKRLQSDHELTTSGEILGTPAYMPPEQARGDLNAIGPASDVYALGAILYATLSGRPPHSAPSMLETLRQVIEVDAVSVRTLSPGTPKDLETICAKCLAKEPVKRYASAHDLRDELQRFLRGEPIHARPVSIVERAWRWSRRRPALAGLSAALLTLAATFAIGGPLVAVNQMRLKKIAEDNEARATSLAASERDAKDRSNRSLYARTVSLAFQELESGNLMGAEDMLASLPVADRGFEWSYVHSLCHRELQTFLDMNAVARYVEIAPDGVHVVAGGTGGSELDESLYVWQMGNDLPLAIRDGRGIAVSGDGQWIVKAESIDDPEFQIVDSISGEIRQTFAGHEGGTHFATFGGPDETLVATVGRDKTYRVWDVASGQERLKISVPHRQRLHPIALSPDGSTLAWRRVDDGAIEIRETSNGDIRFESPAVASMTGHEGPVAFSPDGSVLALGGFGEINLVDGYSGAAIGNLYGVRAHALAIDFSPDNERLAVASGDGTIRVFDVAARKLLTSITGHEAGQTYGIAAIAFDASGDRIVSGGYDAEIKVWDAWNGDRQSVGESARPASELPSPSQSADFLSVMDGGVEELKFSDDGHYLLATGRDRTARVLDVVTGKPIRQWMDLDGNQGAIDIDPSGTQVVVGGGSVSDQRPGSIVAFDFVSGQQAWKFTETGGPVSMLRFMNSGNQIAVGIGSQRATIGHLMVLDATTGKLVWRNQESILPVTQLAVSPDGKTIASVGSDVGITLWDAVTGIRRGRIGERRFFAVAFSESGSRLATGGIDWSVRLFDVDSGAPVWSQIRHSGAVTRVAFTQNDSRLISTSVDGYTRIWDTRYGDSIMQMRDSDQQNLALAVSPDASVIAVAGLNPTIVLRRTPPSNASANIGPDGIIADEKRWVTVIKDDFQRDVIGDAWMPGGQWTVEDGVATGQLSPMPYAVGLNAVNLASKTMLPSDFEVSFDCWIDSPMVVEAKVSDVQSVNAISTLFVGMQASPFNRGEKGVAVVQAFRSNYREVGSRREGKFTFDVGRKYRLVTRRLGQRIDLFVDEELYRTVHLAMETPMPMMSLQGIFGKLGGKIYVDNVLVRVPPESLAEMKVARLVSDLYDSEEIKPLVIAKLEKLDQDALGDDPVSTRAAATTMAANWFQDEDLIIAKIEEMAGKGDQTPDVYKTLSDWIEDNFSVKSQRAYRALEMCAFRAGIPGKTWEALKQADQIHKRENGFRHPIDVSIAAMLMWRGANQKTARDYLRQINQFMLADHWQSDPQVLAWTDLARQTIDESVSDANADLTIRALSETTWKQQHSLLIEGDAGPLENSLADGAIRIIRRNSGGDQYSTTTSRNDWILSEKAWARGGYRSLRKLTRLECTVDLQTDTPTMTSHFFLAGQGAGFGWIQNDTFRKIPGIAPEQWKIIKQTWRLVTLRIDDEFVKLDEAQLVRLDKKVDEARASGGGPKLLLALMSANRLDEALSVAKELAENSDDAHAQVNLAEISQWCGKTDTLEAAADRAITLDPMVRAPEAIRAIAAKKLMSEKPFEFAENATCRPPAFYRWASTKLLAAGDAGLASWQPTEDSLIGITQLPPQPELTLDAYAAAIIESRQAGYSAKTIRRHTRQIDGYPVQEFVQRGLGIGRAITRSGKPTVQRFSLIDRDGDPLLVFVTAYEDDFAMREAEYEQFLQTMKLQPAGEQPKP